MAALILESLPQTKTGILTAVRTIELVLLSTGLIYSILMFKGAVFASSCDFMLSSLRKPVSLFRSWLSSPLYICIFMNIIVILIAVSSHNPKGESNSDIEDGGGDTHEDYDLHSALSPSLSPPPAPPPMQNHQKNHLQERKPKDIAVAAPAAAARVAIATTKSSGGDKITTATTSLKNQQDTEEERVVECHQQAVFSDFSRLAKAKEIRKAQAANDGGKIRTAKQGTRDPIAAKVTDHHDSAQATAKNGQRSRNEEQNQTKKQLENEDGDEDTDTMESTWRAIKGGTKTQEKQLKKSQTWPQPQKLVVDLEAEENMALPMASSGGAALAKELKKSMTFNDTVSITRRGGLRRDPSMNLEEFNQRVEAFIQKFNHEMRLQRQESDQRYLDMISRGL